MNNNLFSVESCGFYAANWPIDFIPAIKREYKNLTVSDCAVLEYISKNLRFINVKNEGAQRPYKASYRKLACEFDVSKNTMYSSINFLVKAGLLVRVEKASYVINCKKINGALLEYREKKAKPNSVKVVPKIGTKNGESCPKNWDKKR